VTDVLEAPTPAAAPGTFPVPAGRGRWRLTLHQRTYAPTPVTATVISELSEARNRKLVRAHNTPAVFTFDLDGWRPAARYIAELGTEVIAWRWDDTTGADVCYFRGPITASADTIDEQSHTVTITATDYLASLARRISTTVTAGPYGNVDQDLCVQQIVYTGIAVATSGGLTITPGNYLPLWPGIYNGYVVPVNPDGTNRPTYTGITRTFTLQGNTVILTALDDMSKLAGSGASAGGNAFDYDLAPLEQSVVGAGNATYDALRIFYPRQGVIRTAPALYYPGNVTALSRQVTSADYSNYWRTIGNNQNTTQNAAQLYGEAYTGAASAGQAGAVGLWMSGDSQADQIDVTNWLTQVAQGQLNIYSVLMPTYTLTLAPGSYYENAFAMGDTLPLIVQSGRLNVNTSLRVMGLTFETTDDGTEVVTLTVGRAPTTLVDMLGDQAADIRALSRR
jgi:hypothetical protein